MDIAFENKVRERAYAFWLAGGMGEGDAEHHWLHAEAAVRQEMPQTAQPTAAKAKLAVVKPAAAKSARGKKASAKPVETIPADSTRTAVCNSTKPASVKKAKALRETAEATL